MKTRLLLRSALLSAAVALLTMQSSCTTAQPRNPGPHQGNIVDAKENPGPHQVDGANATSPGPHNGG